eukprot:8380131-Prorocentrum_lima.AAC.1
MTSSLVGSEMCIRDRVWREAEPSIATHLARQNDCRGTTRARQCARQCTDCLLYTSDAADDM